LEGEEGEVKSIFSVGQNNQGRGGKTKPPRPTKINLPKMGRSVTREKGEGGAFKINVKFHFCPHYKTFECVMLIFNFHSLLPNDMRGKWTPLPSPSFSFTPPLSNVPIFQPSYQPWYNSAY